MIEISNLRVRRGKAEVLHGIDLHVAAGQTLGLLGPSGSGKSTLMRSLAGVQAKVRGQVSIAGHPATSRAAARIRSYMPQNAPLYEELTVRANVTIWAKIRGANHSQARTETEEILELVGLAPFANRIAKNLSGGQKNRTCLAASLVGNPRVLLLDEPTVGLDPLLREEIWDLLRERAQAGAAVIVSSHVMDEAARCDNVCLLRAGRTLVTAPAHDIIARAQATTMDEAFLTLIRDDIHLNESARMQENTINKALHSKEKA